MSDYLNNLVARTLNLTPVVQPRLNSLFEPVSASDANVDIASFETETTRVDSSPMQRRAEVQIETKERGISSARYDVAKQSRNPDGQPYLFGPITPQPPASVASHVIPETPPSPSANRERSETSLIVRPQTSVSADAMKQQDSAVASNRNLDATPAAAEGPGTITVTIGRVDVRAVFAPPPPTAVNRSQPRAPLSLDEYLKQRSGGRR